MFDNLTAACRRLQDIAASRSGLDPAEAFQIIQWLEELAQRRGGMIETSEDQRRQEMYYLGKAVCLLAKHWDGR